MKSSVLFLAVLLAVAKPEDTQRKRGVYDYGYGSELSQKNNGYEVVTGNSFQKVYQRILPEYEDGYPEEEYRYEGIYQQEGINQQEGHIKLLHPMVKKISYPIKQTLERPLVYSVRKAVPLHKIYYPVAILKPYPVPVERKVYYPVHVQIPMKTHYPVEEKVPVPVRQAVYTVHKIPIQVKQLIAVEKRVPVPVYVKAPYPVRLENQVPHPVPVLIRIPVVKSMSLHHQMKEPETRYQEEVAGSSHTGSVEEKSEGKNVS